MGRPFSEAQLLGYASAYEQERSTAVRRRRRQRSASLGRQLFRFALAPRTGYFVLGFGRARSSTYAWINLA